MRRPRSNEEIGGLYGGHSRSDSFLMIDRPNRPVMRRNCGARPQGGGMKGRITIRPGSANLSRSTSSAQRTETVADDEEAGPVERMAVLVRGQHGYRTGPQGLGGRRGARRRQALVQSRHQMLGALRFDLPL